MRSDLPVWKRIGRAVAYLGVPASLATGSLLSSFTILTSLYFIALIGVIAVFRGIVVRGPLFFASCFLVAWYSVLLLIELVHGEPFGYDHLPVTESFLLNFFVLLAFPFFVNGLRFVEAQLRMFDWAVAATIVIATAVSLYELFGGQARPLGLNSNPIIFGMIVAMWGVLLFSRALADHPLNVPKLVIALIGSVPVVLSGSRLAWICGLVGYCSVFVWWARAAGRWRLVAALFVAALPTSWLLYQTESVRARVDQLYSEMGAFLATGDTSGLSLGLRLAADWSGFRAFVDRPLLGYGLAQTRAAALAHRPPTAGDIALLDHLHNEYLTHGVAFGILGPVFLLAFFGIWFFTASRCIDVGMRRFAFVAPVLFMIYAAGEVLFRWPEIYGLCFFVFGLVFLGLEKNAPILPRRCGSASAKRRTHWQLPAPHILAIVVALVIGSAGYVWSQRDTYALVAQKAVLYEGNPGDQAAASFGASVVWRLAKDAAGGAKIVGNLAIPAEGTRIDLTIRKNTDQTLPMSHIVELQTFPPANFPDRTITGVGALVVKTTPDEVGTPLAGVVADAGDGLFWIGLYPDQSKFNMRLLATGNFFDLPLVYRSGEKAKLTFEKGHSGYPLFQSAVAAWSR